MFEAAELGRKVGKREYAEEVPRLRTELLRVQNELCADPAFSVVIVIAGVEGAGKGETVNVLHQWMDPRYLEAHAYGPPSQEESARPPLWRYWRDIPAKGNVGVFFGSWYTQPIVDRVFGDSSESDLESSLQQIEAFERELCNGGVLLLKFWFHLSKKDQRRTFKHLARKQSWRVTKRDREMGKHYDEFVPVCELALRRTSTGHAPWTLIEGTDRRYRELAVGRHVLAAIDARLKEPRPVAGPAHPPEPLERVTGQPTILSRVDLSKRLTRDEYEERLASAQTKLGSLSRDCYECGASGVLVFEGVDAAGKGGAIRRVTAALDARFYNIVPIAAPTDEERARPYMWRFWRRLPTIGHVTVFDRSWYGRVLVERVEGFANPDAWRQAYREINDFENSLFEHGYGVGKFWLHIDPDEQARRFAEREQTSYKQYKITDEDYRNREKWSLYEDAVNEMVERTSTSHAPWTLVPANDKLWARVSVVETCCQVLEAALRRSS